MLCTIMSVHHRPPPLLFPLNPTMHMLPYHFRGIPLVRFTLRLMWLMQYQVYKCKENCLLHCTTSEFGLLVCMYSTISVYRFMSFQHHTFSVLEHYFKNMACFAVYARQLFGIQEIMFGIGSVLTLSSRLVVFWLYDLGHSKTDNPPAGYMSPDCHASQRFFSGHMPQQWTSGPPGRIPRSHLLCACVESRHGRRPSRT